jgi:hypothetical protein
VFVVFGQVRREITVWVGGSQKNGHVSLEILGVFWARDATDLRAAGTKKAQAQ